jgi:hypothetical protein
VDDGALVGVLVLCGRVSANIDSIDWVHPQLSHNGHPVDDGALVGAGSLWPG